jgi:hypothetical protein
MLTTPLYNNTLISFLYHCLIPPTYSYIARFSVCHFPIYDNIEPMLKRDLLYST